MYRSCSSYVDAKEHIPGSKLAVEKQEQEKKTKKSLLLGIWNQRVRQDILKKINFLR
jgi:hypothetical protein